MLINLVTLWKEGILPEVLNKANTDSPVIAQSSFQFDTHPNVIFVGDMKTQTEATHYGDLPSLALCPDEQQIYDLTLEQLRKNPVFYNGNQLLLTGAVYDTESHILYLEAVRVDYVFLVALEKMKQLKSEKSALLDRDFFKTGVLTPFVSKDNTVSIITRKDRWSLRSVASGFLECTDHTHPLSNLITETAVKEADEEFLLDVDQNRRLHFTCLPTIASLSFRDAIGMGMTPTIEFVAPIQLNHDAKFILHIMNHNEAPHAHEHVPASAINVPLDSDERTAASQFMNQKLPGNFLYGPVLHACAVQANPRMPLAPRITQIPNSRFYPISFFKPALKKSLTPIPSFTFSILNATGAIVRGVLNNSIYHSERYHADDIFDLFISPANGSIYTGTFDASETFVPLPSVGNQALVLIKNIRADRLDALLQLRPHARLAQPKIAAAIAAARLSAAVSDTVSAPESVDLPRSPSLRNN